MKKFLFITQVIFILALVPAVTVAYLYNPKTDQDNSVKADNKNDMSGQHQTTGVIRLIRVF
jgi:hypothetical protein